ncbi:MAG: copper chaperone CopZ [Vicingaceae bacterium]|jgi:copper chaperone CopZ
MKKRVLKAVFVTLFAFSGSSLMANNSALSEKVVLANDSTVEEFKVYGNCGMCKKTIEGSLKDEESIYSAVWNKETKMIEVNYNEDALSLDEIKKKIAEVGYDTEEYRATEETYKELPGCCQYERPEEK